MSDEEKLHKQVRKARFAEDLLQNEAFTDAISEMKSELFGRWQVTTDAVERDRIWIAVNLVEKIPTALKKTLSNGKMSKSILEKMLKTA